MDEALWPTPDLYAGTRWLQAQRTLHCAECVGSLVGARPRDWRSTHADGARWLTAERRRLLYKPSVRCLDAEGALAGASLPVGMSLPSRSWARIAQHAAAFCERGLVAFDDALRAMMRAARAVDRVLEPAWLTHAYPRALDVGACGPRSAAATAAPACSNASADLNDDLGLFARAWVAPMLPGGYWSRPPHTLEAAQRALPRHPREAWRVPEGVALCRERYAHGADGGPTRAALELDTASNKTATLPRRFEEVCLAIVKGER